MIAWVKNWRWDLMNRRMLKLILYKIVHLVSLFYHFFNIIIHKYFIRKKVTVLVYHRICSFPEEENFEYLAVDPSEFMKQMEYLYNHGITVLTVAQLLDLIDAGVEFSGNAVCITFDDGYENNYTYAFPVLQKFGFNVSIYLAAKYINTNKRLPWLKQDVKLTEFEAQDSSISGPLSWRQITELSDFGNEFGNHSYSHPDFSGLSGKEVSNEIGIAHEILKDHLLNAPTSFVCPFGKTKLDVGLLKKVLLKYGYRGAFLGRMGSVEKKSDVFDLPRISVYGSDTLKVFIRKVHGSYDWLGWFQPLWLRINHKQ